MTWPKEFWGGGWVKVLFYYDEVTWTVENEAGDVFQIDPRLVVETKDRFVRLP